MGIFQSRSQTLRWSKLEKGDLGTKFLGKHVRSRSLDTKEMSFVNAEIHRISRAVVCKKLVLGCSENKKSPTLNF